MDDKNPGNKLLKLNMRNKEMMKTVPNIQISQTSLDFVDISKTSEVKIEMLNSDSMIEMSSDANILTSLLILDDISKRIPTLKPIEDSDDASVVEKESLPATPKPILTPATDYLNRMKPQKKVEGIEKVKNSFTAFAEEFVDVRTMETGLLNLLTDFHKGKLQAFGKDDAFHKMDEVRVLQERVSRKHFELEILQQTRGFESRESREKTDLSIAELMEQLGELCDKIQDIHNDMQRHNKIVFPNHVSKHRKRTSRHSQDSVPGGDDDDEDALPDGVGHPRARTTPTRGRHNITDGAWHPDTAPSTNAGKTVTITTGGAGHTRPKTAPMTASAKGVATLATGMSYLRAKAAVANTAAKSKGAVLTAGHHAKTAGAGGARGPTVTTATAKSKDLKDSFGDPKTEMM